MKKPRTSLLSRELRASFRDTLILFREFRKPLLLFFGLILGSGFLFFRLSMAAGEPISGLSESVYLMLTLTFLQPGNVFPKAWYLQTFYFLLPVLGLSIVAQGLTDFGVLLFNRRSRGKEWEMAIASTYSNHIILIGLGHLGYRVARKLVEMDQEVVVIEMNPQPELLDAVRVLRIPVLAEDGTHDKVLISAGVQKAKTILLCTQDDVANLKMALKARSLNPGIEVVVRIFDDDFADSIQKQFGFRAMSATGMAAPIFAASAAGVDITPPITIDGQANSLARIQVSSHSPLEQKTIAFIEKTYDISVVLLRRNGTSDYHPESVRTIQQNDTLGILGTPEQISLLVHDNS